MQQIKEISNSLIVAGASVTDRDLIAATLVGLPDEYELLIDSIMLHLSPTTLDELHGLFRTKELSEERNLLPPLPHNDFKPSPFILRLLKAPILPTPQVFATQYPQSQNFVKHNLGN